MFVKNVTYFGEFGYLNSSCIRKKCYLNVSEFVQGYIYAFVAKLSDGYFGWFPAAILVPTWMGVASPCKFVYIWIKILRISRLIKVAVT